MRRAVARLPALPQARGCSSKAAVPQMKPYFHKVEAGKTYSWCSCGASKKQPFCDGAHNAFNKEHSTEFKSVKYTADKDKTMWFCGCKRTGNQPECDFSHVKVLGGAIKKKVCPTQ